MTIAENGASHDEENGVAKDVGVEMVEDDFIDNDIDDAKEGAIDDENGEDNEDKANAYPLPVGDVTCWRLVRSPMDFIKLTFGWVKHNKSQVLSGVTVALAQIPEAVSFSFVAGVDPIVGLQSAWIMGICTSLAGGRPGMVAGATGAVAVVLTNLVETKGIGHMFYAIMLAGILQMLFGLLGLGVVIRMVPHPVMVGFCNGLGLVIGLAQFNIFKDRPDEEERRFLAGGGGGEDGCGGGGSAIHTFGAFAPFTSSDPWIDTTQILWMCFHIAMTLIIFIGFPKITKAIPASLAGIIGSTILEWALVRPIGYRTNTVEDLASVAGSFPVPVWFDTTYGYRDILPPFSGTLIGEVFPTAVTAATIGLLESLLTLQLIDEILNNKGNSNREAFGQGLGQFLSGMLGGMGGCTTIGQSFMNIHSGGFTRLSSSTAAVFMLLIILAAYPLINLIPIASLAGVMFVVTYFTIEWESGWAVLGSALPLRLRNKWGIHTKVKRSDVVIMLIVVAITLILDLAIAVGCGIVIACLVFAWDAGSRIHVERELEGSDTVVYTVRGPLFFGSIKPFMGLFADPKTDPPNAIVILQDAEIYDWSGMVAIKALHDRFENNGTTVSFQKLTVASQRLMTKSKKMWEGITYLEANELVEPLQDKQNERTHADNEYHAHL